MIESLFISLQCGVEVQFFSGAIQGHHITAPHATHHPLRIEWLIFALYATKLGRTFYKDMLSPSILLFFFLIAEMDVPSAFDRAIRYSVLTYQRSTFDRAVTALLRSFLRFPVTGEIFR